MADPCPNCGKPVLPTDVACWHCGYQLPKRPKAQPDTSGAAAPAAGHLRRRSEAGDQSVDYDFRALIIYGLLTVVIVAGLWLVMRSLSRQPILVRSAGLEIGGDWVTVTDSNLRYTLSFPTDWQWLDVAFRDQDDLLGQVISRQPYMGHALRPLGDPTGDVEIVGLAIDTRLLEDSEPKPFVVVGQSARLAGLDAQAALDRLEDEALPLTETEIDRRLAGQTQARFTFMDNAAAYQCRHLFVSSESKPGYLVAACAPQSRYGTMQRELDDILDSFQLLEY